MRNAVDGQTASALFEAFVRFESDEDRHVAVLTGNHGAFCAGADLQAIAAGNGNRVDRLAADGPADEAISGPMGPTRLQLTKPVIAAVEGYAVAGGLELALWCDLRVMAADATFGVFCRRWGVPLIDGGTVRLPRLIGESRAMDLILTGRAVDAEEALAIGLANRVCPPGEALATAVALAHEIAAFPQQCVRSDATSAKQQWGLGERAALARETELGLETIRSGETLRGAARFASGAGRHGDFGT